MLCSAQIIWFVERKLWLKGNWLKDFKIKDKGTTDRRKNIENR